MTTMNRLNTLDREKVSKCEKLSPNKHCKAEEIMKYSLPLNATNTNYIIIHVNAEIIGATDKLLGAVMKNDIGKKM